jgi:hypothetical protein
MRNLKNFKNGKYLGQFFVNSENFPKFHPENFLSKKFKGS